MHLTPCYYRKCGHAINIVAGGVHDVDEALWQKHQQTGEPVVLDWSDGKCWRCTGPQPVGAETIEALRQVKENHDGQM